MSKVTITGIMKKITDASVADGQVYIKNVSASLDDGVIVDGGKEVYDITTGTFSVELRPSLTYQFEFISKDGLNYLTEQRTVGASDEAYSDLTLVSTTDESVSTDFMDGRYLKLSAGNATADTVEWVEDTVNLLVSGGANVTVTYDDDAGTFIISATQLSQEEVEDYVDGLVVGGNGITTTYNDVAGTLTLSLTDNAFTDAEKAKLSNIEDSATADQTDAEIKTAYENNADTNAFTDAEESKLGGIEAGAEVNIVKPEEFATGFHISDIKEWDTTGSIGSAVATSYPTGLVMTTGTSNDSESIAVLDDGNVIAHTADCDIQMRFMLNVSEYGDGASGTNDTKFFGIGDHNKDFFGIVSFNSSIYAYSQNKDISSYQFTDIQALLAVNTWYDILLTWNADTGEEKFYVDETLVETFTGAGVINSSTVGGDWNSILATFLVANKNLFAQAGRSAFVGNPQYWIEDNPF